MIKKPFINDEWLFLFKNFKFCMRDLAIIFAAEHLLTRIAR
jgi:hypothetical protein